MPVGNCQQSTLPSSFVGVTNMANGVVNITATIVDLTGASGTLLQVNPLSTTQRATTATRQIPANSSVQIGNFFDPCVSRDAGGPFTAEIRVQVTAGQSTFLLLFPMVGVMTPPL